jgi:hypothetical protein
MMGLVDWTRRIFGGSVEKSTPDDWFREFGGGGDRRPAFGYAVDCDQYLDRLRLRVDPFEGRSALHAAADAGRLCADQRSRLLIIRSLGYLGVRTSGRPGQNGANRCTPRICCAAMHTQ